MTDTTVTTDSIKSTVLKAVAKAVVDRGAAVLATFLIGHGLLAQSQAASFDETTAGIGLALIAGIVALYREYGHAIIKARLAKWQADAEAEAAAAQAKSKQAQA